VFSRLQHKILLIHATVLCRTQPEQQRVVVGPENGGNSFLVARWRPPQAEACRVHRCFCYGRCRGRPPAAADAAAATAAVGWLLLVLLYIPTW